MGYEGDHDGTVLFPVPRTGILAVRRIAHGGEDAPFRCSVVCIVWGIVEGAFPCRPPPLCRSSGGACRPFLRLIHQVQQLHVGVVSAALVGLLG